MNTQFITNNHSIKIFYILTWILNLLYTTRHFVFANGSDVLCNISFIEHLPDEGHNRLPKHVGGYADYSIMNLHICICIS